MNKFNFYLVYMNDFEKLNVFQFKKLVIALCKYTEDGTLPDNLSRKTQAVFNKVQRIIDVENDYQKYVENKSKAGKKGSSKRWKNTHNNKVITKR